MMLGLRRFREIHGHDDCFFAMFRHPTLDRYHSPHDRDCSRRACSCSTMTQMRWDATVKGSIGHRDYYSMSRRLREEEIFTRREINVYVYVTKTIKRYVNSSCGRYWMIDR